MPVLLFDGAGPADFAACRRLLRHGSKSFFAASMLLPGRLRPAVTALYAFCRVADDMTDGAAGEPVRGAAALSRLRRRLALVYEGRPLDHPVDRAFAATVEACAIPRALPEALFEGFAWDTDGRRYETLAELRAYAARVAGTVGAMMTLLMGIEDREAMARACDLGVAMQLTNIARDVGEDARAGRLYIPTGWFREAGVDPDAWLAQPTHDLMIAGFVGRLLAEADRLYHSAESGIGLLPRDCRPAIWAARFIYAGIGDRIELNALDSVSRRAVVPNGDKLRLLARAMLRAGFGSGRKRASGARQALAEVGFILEAASERSGAAAQPRNLGQKIEWVIELFERLERSDRQRVAASRTSIGARAAS